jgi:hypothetical protein
VLELDDGDEDPPVGIFMKGIAQKYYHHLMLHHHLHQCFLSLMEAYHPIFGLEAS